MVVGLKAGMVVEDAKFVLYFIICFLNYQLIRFV